MEKSTKFLLWSGAIIGILALLKYKILTPKVDSGTGTAKGDEEKIATESEESGGIGGGGMGGGTGLSGTGANLSTLNSLANTTTPSTGTSTSANVGTSSVVSSILGSSTTPTAQTSGSGGSGRNTGDVTTISTGVAPRTNVTQQLGFNGKKSFGFKGEINNNGLFI